MEAVEGGGIAGAEFCQKGTLVVVHTSWKSWKGGVMICGKRNAALRSLADRADGGPGLIWTALNSCASLRGGSLEASAPPENLGKDDSGRTADVLNLCTDQSISGRLAPGRHLQVSCLLFHRDARGLAGAYILAQYTTCGGIEKLTKAHAKPRLHVSPSFFSITW